MAFDPNSILGLSFSDAVKLCKPIGYTLIVEFFLDNENHRCIVNSQSKLTYNSQYDPTSIIYVTLRIKESLGCMLDQHKPYETPREFFLRLFASDELTNEIISIQFPLIEPVTPFIEPVAHELRPDTRNIRPDTSKSVRFSIPSARSQSKSRSKSRSHSKPSSQSNTWSHSNTPPSLFSHIPVLKSATISREQQQRALLQRLGFKHI